MNKQKDFLKGRSLEEAGVALAVPVSILLWSGLICLVMLLQ